MKKLVCVVLVMVLLTGCSPAGRGESASLFAMDTLMELTAYGGKAREALDAADAEIRRLDAVLSAQREGSDVYRLNRAQGAETAVEPETRAVLAGVLELCAATEGALDITVYPAVEAWGFPSGAYRVPDGAELERLGELVDYKAVSLSSEGDAAGLPAGMKLDLGAVGKGFTADRVAALWKDMGVTSGLLNLGGNVHCVGARPDGSDWTVAVRHPEDDTGYLCTVTGRDMAVVTSGAYQRNFQQDGVTYHHILDPETCAPARSGLLSVTIVGESGLLCDGLSTAVFVMGEDRAAQLWRERRDFEMILYTEGGALWVTAGLEGRVTPAEGLELRVIYD